MTLALAACDSSEPAKPAPAVRTGTATATAKATTGASAAAAGGSASAAASASAAPGGELSPDGYRLDRIKPIAEDCKTAFMVVSAAKKDAFGKSGWPMIDQAMHEHPNFKVVTGMPAKAMEIRFERYEMTDKPDMYLLAARCFDGATCNRLAAMYRGVVLASNPQLVCAAQIPGTRGAGVTMVLSPKHLDDVRTKCARIAVCMHKLDRALEKDMNLECQRSPHHFKLDCHQKSTCQEVVDCNKAGK